MHRICLILIATLVLTACSSLRDADICRDDEAIAIPLSIARSAQHADEPLDLQAFDAFAATAWRGSRPAAGHARLGCWYDQEPDAMAKIVTLSIEQQLRSVDDWLEIADRSAHDAVRAAVLTALLDDEQAVGAVLPRWMGLMSGDGRGLHVSALKTLAFTDHPAAMAAVIAAIEEVGYPGDGMLGAPFMHDLEGWAAAQQHRYWSVVWPTYWLLGLDAPADTSVVDRIREVDAVERELEVTRRALNARTLRADEATS